MADDDDSDEEEASSMSTMSTATKKGGAKGGGGSGMCLCLCVVCVLGLGAVAAGVAFILLKDGGTNTTANGTEEVSGAPGGSSAGSAGSGATVVTGEGGSESAAGEATTAAGGGGGRRLPEDAPLLDAYGRFATDDVVVTTPDDTESLKGSVVARQRLNRKTARARSAKRLPNNWSQLSHHSEAPSTAAEHSSGSNRAGGIKRGKEAAMKNATNRAAGPLASRTTRKGSVRAPPGLVTAKQRRRNVSSLSKTLKRASQLINITNETVLPEYDGGHHHELGMPYPLPDNTAGLGARAEPGSPLSNLTTDTTDPKKAPKARKEEEITNMTLQKSARGVVNAAPTRTNTSVARLSPDGGGVTADRVSRGKRGDSTATLTVGQTRRVGRSRIASNNSGVEEQSGKGVVWRFQNEA